ncbi:class I SAM-dependent methyltransferase [Jiella endophytica]|uniref:Class I SAM-dependent methyltransferase n=1 Tax=Jiella endophytica TaxID=2558362 RepID=A0A4Y8R9T2_9HYPH|nr:class I SAM-dependent methyltransferase [Jiella endophytica]TFF18367.1 class I SAM-dependent methyltransferase [Jiella endophytica]
MGRVIDADGFEALFRADPDPWNYAGSLFERNKREVLLKGCGPRCRGRVLELACANGETTAALRRSALRLVAQDASPTALAHAAARNVGAKNVRFVRGLLPQGLPRGPFDLIVASEILYYLPRRDLEACLRRIEAALAPGGRLVALHHVVPFGDAATRPAAAARLVERHCRRRLLPALSSRTSRYRMDAFDKPLARSGPR